MEASHPTPRVRITCSCLGSLLNLSLGVSKFSFEKAKAETVCAELLNTLEQYNLAACDACALVVVFDSWVMM